MIQECTSTCFLKNEYITKICIFTSIYYTFIHIKYIFLKFSLNNLANIQYIFISINFQFLILTIFQQINVLIFAKAIFYS